MSRLFGPMRQMGYVVTDLHRAMEHWSSVCSIGPWFWFERSNYKSFTYNGVRYDDIDITVGFANSGDIQIELIQQRCKTPSMYQEFLKSFPDGGLQHWSSWPVNYHEVYTNALKQGYTIAMEGDHARGPFAYFRQEGHPGTVIEMAELSPGRAQFFDRVREAAADWDGRDPIRKMG
jgi:hypothetical protein